MADNFPNSRKLKFCETKINRNVGAVYSLIFDIMIKKIFNKVKQGLVKNFTYLPGSVLSIQ